jgi:hypothetical protein
VEEEDTGVEGDTAEEEEATAVVRFLTNLTNPHLQFVLQSLEEGTREVVAGTRAVEGTGIDTKVSPPFLLSPALTGER